VRALSSLSFLLPLVLMQSLDRYVWALVELTVLASQERAALSAMLEFVSFVRPSTRYGGVHIDRRSF